MEFAKLIRLFRRWFWLIIVAAVLGAGASYVSNSNVRPKYLAEAKVLIGGFLASPNPNRSDIETGSWLAETYVQLATTTPVLQGVVDDLSLPIEATDLSSGIVLAGKPGDAPIIVIQVYYEDPDMAIQIANKVAEQLILKSPSNLTPGQEAQIKLANNQIALLDQQLQETQAQIAAIDQRLAEAGAQDELNPLSLQRTALVEQVNQASANMAQFSSTIAALEQQTNTIQVIQPAIEADAFSTGPGRFESMILTALVGMVLATAGILAIGYLDPTIRTSKDSSALVDIPVLGTIPQFGGKNGDYAKKLIIGLPPRSTVSEAYRTLETNLLFAAKSNSTKTYIITSPSEHEGKTITAANLAVTMALGSLNVLLIDADLVRPTIHDVFGLENTRGLTNLLEHVPAEAEMVEVVGKKSAQYSIQGDPNYVEILKSVIQKTNIPQLRIITGGPIIDKSAQLLSSSDLQKWIDVLLSDFNVDVILFDTSPCLQVADTSILAARIKADCILVVHSGRTQRSAALRAQHQFEHIGINIQGIILNRVQANDMDHGYTSGYVRINANNGYPHMVAPYNNNNHAQPEYERTE